MPIKAPKSQRNHSRRRHMGCHRRASLSRSLGLPSKDEDGVMSSRLTQMMSISHSLQSVPRLP